MITIDGAYGQGTCLCGWTPSTANAPSIPSYIGAYVGISPPWSPCIPFSCRLPPKGMLYHTGFTAYGGKVQSVEVGSLQSSNGNRHDPLPCRHTTVTGTITPLGEGGGVYAQHPYMRDSVPGGGPYYHSNGNKVSFLGGKAITHTDPGKAYDHEGNLQVMSGSSAYAYYWYYYHWYLLSHVPTDIITSAIPNEHAVHDEWIWNINPPSVGDYKPRRCHRSSWKHVSANVWKEQYWTEYHSSASYTPKLPLGWSGVPYVVAQMHCTRTHRLRYIRQEATSVFRLYFDIDETLEYYGKPTSSNWTWNTEERSYANSVNLEVFAPGLSTSLTPDLTGLDDYCRHGAARAVSLYSEKNMGVARSNAIADVSALESNWLENFSQVGGYADIFDPLVEGYEAAKANDVVAAGKALASAYLVYKYCMAPTVSDSKDLSKNLKTQIRYSTRPIYSNERRRGNYILTTPLGDREATIGYFCTYHMVLKDTSFATVLNALERLGLDPSTVNGWDFIPYSFVVDWFLSIGSALEKISAYNNARLSRELQWRVQTFKVVWPLNTTELTRYIPCNWKVNGPFLYSWYDRRIAKRWGTFDPFAGQSNDGLSWSQMTQGAALLMSALM